MRVNYRVGPFGLIIFGLFLMAVIIDAVVILGAVLGVVLIIAGLRYAILANRQRRALKPAKPEPYVARHYVVR